MANTVREPGQDVEDRIRMCGEDVGEVGAVENVLKGWEDLDPDMWAVLDRNETTVMAMLADLCAEV